MVNCWEGHIIHKKFSIFVWRTLMRLFGVLCCGCLVYFVAAVWCTLLRLFGVLCCGCLVYFVAAVWCTLLRLGAVVMFCFADSLKQFQLLLFANARIFDYVYLVFKLVHSVGMNFQNIVVVI